MVKQRRHAISVIPLAATLALGIAAFFAPPPACANDGMFPAAPAAKSSIDFDGKGFLVKGKRTFLVSAGLEYARIPHELWRDRLLKIKRAGFNCVEIYVFWNFHEPQEGKWNFSGDHDLNAFLKLVNQMGLYATVRVGPYVCAEWDSGGYPVWLRFKPGLGVREDNPLFEQYVDKYFDKIIPIVAANQINRGGSVVMVQLENEHPLGWGTEEPNAYFRHLREKAVSLGLEVPYFFSGLHHASDPAGNRPWDSAGRTNPWFSTEFWCDWYDIYGNPTPKATTFEDRATWKIIAYGGNGYNYYMFHGGTNFDHWNSNEDTSSYDYGAAIGQGGDLRPIYYKFKRAAMFATTFADVLENSTNATEQYAGAATNPAVKVTARTSPSGTIVFLDNPTNASVETQVKIGDRATLPSTGPIRLEAGEIMPIVLGYQLTPGVTMDAFTRVLSVVRQNGNVTVIVYGPKSGGNGNLYLQNARGGDPSKPTQVDIQLNYQQDQRVVRLPVEHPKPSDVAVNVISLSDADADKTFLPEVDGKTYIVSGVPYLEAMQARKDAFDLTIGMPCTAGTSSSPLVFDPNGEAHTFPVLTNAETTNPIYSLSAWQAKSAAEEAKPDFDDKNWKSSDAPLAMGADGDDGAYAWYRTTVHAPHSQHYVLSAGAIRDRAEVWVDGTRVPGQTKGNSIPLDLATGDHSVALLAIHDGRDKLFGHLGPIDTIDAKGLTGPAALRQNAPGGATLTGWQYQRTDNAHRGTPPAATDTRGAADAKWIPVAVGQDVFDKQRGLAWYQATLPAMAPGATAGVLHFEGVDDNGTIYLNGKRIGAHKGWNEAFDVPIAATDLRTDSQPNVVAVLVENTENTGGIAAPVTLATYAYNAPVVGWKMRGGTVDPLSNKGWTPYATELSLSPGGSGPRVYRATFTAAPPAATGAYPILRATFAGLSHGFMYLNGHNLGRYPEKVPIDGIYLPECYLKSGTNANMLTILDEEGSAPTQVRVEVEVAASRVVHEATGK